MAPKFSLQPVLDYRHSRVELLEVELGRLRRDQQRGQTFLEALQASRSRLMDQLGQSQQGDIDLFMVASLRASLNKVGERIEQQKNRLLALAEQVQATQQEIVAARQAEEALAVLKEKELERYELEQAQQEHRLQDDIYIAQAYRRASSTV